MLSTFASKLCSALFRGLGFVGYHADLARREFVSPS
jgi:hypothetical protein